MRSDLTHEKVLVSLRDLIRTVNSGAAWEPSSNVATSRHIDPETIGLETALDDLGFDSLGAAGFVVEIETFYRVQLPPLLLFYCKTVGDLVDQIIKIHSE